MTKLEENISKEVAPIIENIGYDVYDIIYEKQGKENYLNIFIDKKEGITTEDCEKVNNEITDILDKKDLIKDSYFLVISSPGIERVLREEKHFKENIDSKIKINLYKKYEDLGKELIGILKSYDKENIVINIDEKKLKIKREDISLIKTVFDW